jgi:hypothetical protein
MATLLSIATGNFTSASTWSSCFSGGTLTSGSTATALTTSYQESSTFNGANAVVDAVAVQVAVRTGTTGTITLHLTTSAVEVVGSPVTINCSDIDAGDSSANGGCGWYVFKFSAPLTLLIANTYTVGLKTSSASQISLFRATGTNWNRLCRSTTTAAPGAGDAIYVAGEFTAAATSSSFTVTMDESATTAYDVVSINSKSTLTWKTSADTYLKCKTITGYGGGTWNRIVTSSARASILEFNSTTGAEFGFNRLGGFTCTETGATKTSLQTLMTADKASSATVIAVASTTDWAVSDEIAYPTTTRTASQGEKKTILTVDSSTQITNTAGLTNAHGGDSTTGVQAKVGNLTRNVKTRGVSAANTGFINNFPGAIVDEDYIEYVNMGSGGVTGGIKVQTTTGSCSMRFCSFHEFTIASSVMIDVSSASGSTIEISDSVFYNTISSAALQIAATTGVNVYNNNLFVKTTGAALAISDAGSTYTNNVSGGGTISVAESGGTVGTFTGNEVYGTSGNGIAFSSSTILAGTISNLKCWRNGGYGLNIASISQTTATNFTFDGCTFFGNATAGVQIFNSGFGDIVFKNCVFNAGATLTQPIGIDPSICVVDTISFENCDFGVTTPHATADIAITSLTVSPLISLYNCRLASTTPISGTTTLIGTNRLQFKGIFSHKHGGVAGAVKVWNRFGIITTDTTIFNTASPSARCTPSNASFKQQFSSKFVPVASGGTATVSVSLRKSVVGDGAAYNGNQPRLMVRKNLEAGITSDTVIATATNAANGAWEVETGTSAAVSADTVLEFFIDCDGTAGWINVDDFTTTSTTVGTAYKYWIYGQPVLGNNAGSSTSTGAVANGTFPYRRRRFGNRINSNV